MHVQETSVQLAAHNIANCSTDGFVPTHAVLAEQLPGVALQAVLPDRVTLSSLERPPHSGTDLAKEMVQLVLSRSAFEANARTIASADELCACVINLKG